MKTKLTVISILAILVSACTTGTYVTKAYDDDIYFSPADVPPVAVAENEAPASEKSARISNNDTRDKKIILSQMDRNADGTSSVNNYIYQPDNNGNPDNQSYNMDNQELAESDTTAYYNDDDVKYVINNFTTKTTTILILLTESEDFTTHITTIPFSTMIGCMAVITHHGIQDIMEWDMA